MTDLEAMWPAVESSAPGDPTPLLVAADWLGDHPDERTEPLEFALRWCAGNRKRAHRRTDVLKPQWGWVKEKARYQRLTKAEVRERAAAVVPAVLYDHLAHPLELEWSWWTSGQAAYFGLASALATLRAVVAVPDLVLPPPRVVQAPGVVTCVGCGIVRGGDRKECPVCHATDAA